MSHQYTQQTNDVTTVQWLYDEIMRSIEPDLCTHQIPLLQEKYSHETPREKIFRMRAYELAFALFDACLEEIKDDIAIDIASWKQQLRLKALQQEQSEQEEDIASIEQLFHNSAI